MNPLTTDATLFIAVSSVFLLGTALLLAVGIARGVKAEHVKEAAH